MPLRPKILLIFILLICLSLALLKANELKASFFGQVFVGGLKQTVFENESDLSKEMEIDNKAEIYFVGDIMLGRDVERKLTVSGNSYPYQNITFDKEKTFVVANFESAIPEQHIHTPNNTFRFSTNPDFLPELRAAGFSHLSLANNHSFDYGLSGYNNSVSTLWDNNFVPFGHPTVFSTSSVTVINLQGKRVALLGLHTLFNYPDPQNIINVLSYANSISDIQIVYVHWGEEYSEVASQSQRKLATLLARNGTDLIIGHHPHVVQNVEKIDETLVFYSLGNYIFDQYFSDSVQKGLMLKLTLENDVKIELFPVSSLLSHAQPKRLVDKEKTVFLEELALRSDWMLSEQIKAGSFILTVTLASSTEVAMMAE
jgi:gamma-polyglutamate biosynthesis protein CapA